MRFRPASESCPNHHSVSVAGSPCALRLSCSIMWANLTVARGSEFGRLTAKKAGLGALAAHSAESGFCYTPHRLVTRARILQKRGPRRVSFLWLFAILAAYHHSQ